MLRYDSLYRNHLKTAFGNTTIGNIRASDIQEYIAELAKIYHSQYPKSIYNFLKVLFEFAYRQDYITHNTMDKVKPPATEGDKKVELLTEEQFSTLQSALNGKRVQLPFNIGFALGLRASETYALRWSDFNWDTNEVSITKQLQHRDKCWCLAKPKTVNSNRVIKFSEEFSQYLQAIKRLQAEYKASYGAFYKTNKVIDATTNTETVIEVEDFVNLKENGEFMTPHSNKVISRTAKALGFEFNYHMLRHRYFTLLAQSNTNPTLIKNNMGHSKIDTGYLVYCHPSAEEKQLACEVISRFTHFTAPTDL